MQKSTLTITVYHNEVFLDKYELISEANHLMQALDYAYEWDVHCEKEGTL